MIRGAGQVGPVYASIIASQQSLDGVKYAFFWESFVPNQNQVFVGQTNRGELYFIASPAVRQALDDRSGRTGTHQCT